jgi:cell wall-associated NlpC family hydrolase
LDVHDKTLPKNSKDQRRAGKPRPIEKIQDHDLVFCHRKNGSGIHHVGVFIKGEVWHAQLERGVIRQTWEEFRDLYEIEEVTSHLPEDKSN